MSDKPTIRDTEDAREYLMAIAGVATENSNNVRPRTIFQGGFMMGIALALAHPEFCRALRTLALAGESGEAIKLGEEEFIEKVVVPIEAKDDCPDWLKETLDKIEP